MKDVTPGQLLVFNRETFVYVSSPIHAWHNDAKLIHPHQLAIVLRNDGDIVHLLTLHGMCHDYVDLLKRDVSAC
jgi:hypothetical protein